MQWWEGVGTGVIAGVGVSCTLGNMSVAALGPGLPLLGGCIRIGRDTGTERMAVQDMGWRVSYINQHVVQLQEALVEGLTVCTTRRGHYV